MLPNISTATVHRQGTGHKRCPARARRANVPPMPCGMRCCPPRGRPRCPRSTTTPARVTTPQRGRGSQPASSCGRSGSATGCRSLFAHPDQGCAGTGRPSAEATVTPPPPPRDLLERGGEGGRGSKGGGRGSRGGGEGVQGRGGRGSSGHGSPPPPPEHTQSTVIRKIIGE